MQDINIYSTKKHFIIYQTTNLINGMTYIGQHQTDNLNDGYIGSGKHLISAIKRYGKQNFKTVILHNFTTFKEMNDKEIELVNKDFILREDNYNIALGGANALCGINNKGKTTVIEIASGNSMTISCAEMKLNNHLYIPILANMITVKLLSTGKTMSINKKEFVKNKHLYCGVNSKPIMTPNGVFKNITSAAIFYKCTVAGLATMLKLYKIKMAGPNSKFFTKVDIGKTPKEAGFYFI